MSVLTPQQIDAIEAKLRKLEEKHGPKAEKTLKRGKNGEPVIEYFKRGRDHHFDAAKAELAKTSQFVPALPLPPFHNKMERNARRRAPATPPAPRHRQQPKVKPHQRLQRRSGPPPKCAS